MPMAIIFRGGTILSGGREVPGLAVAVEGGRIAALGKEAERRSRRRGRGYRRVDLEGDYLAPGLIDLHTHGAGGVDFFHAAPPQLEDVMATHYLRHGVTRILISLIPAPRRELLEVIRRLAGAIRLGIGRGVIAGLHLEGPFLDPGHPGALPDRHFRAYTPAALEEILEAGGGLVRTMTLAPERPGGLELVRHLGRRGVAAAFGHSGSGYPEARSSIRAGIRYVTHLFNAMDGIHHRRPGPVAAIIEDERVAVELISDGYHVDPTVMRLAARLLSPERICLVSDSVAPCGLRPGRYRFAGKAVRLENGRVTLAGGRLAGSALTLDEALRVQVRRVGRSPAQAAASASLVPARIAGWKDVGEIAPGRRADLVRLGPGLRVRETYLGGARMPR